MAKTYTVAFDLTPATAELALHRESAEGELLAPTAGTTYTLTKGDYFYTVSDFGYVTKSGTLTVTEDTAVSLTLDESERYPLVFTVYPRRAGAVVTLTRADGDKREMTGTDGTYSLTALQMRQTLPICPRRCATPSAAPTRRHITRWRRTSTSAASPGRRLARPRSRLLPVTLTARGTR